MAISDRNINFRGPETTHGQLRWLMDKFEASRTWVLIKSVEHFFTFVAMPWKLREVFDEWEAFSRKIAQCGATQSPKQLRLVFGEPLPAMYPRFGSTGAADRPRPELLEPNQSRVPVEMAAWDTSNLGNFRRIFANFSMRSAA